MTAYVARTGARKKKDALRKREEELQHHLRHGADATTIERVCERLRAAQLGVIKALLHETEPVTDRDDRDDFRRHLTAERDLWQTLSVSEIAARHQPTS